MRNLIENPVYMTYEEMKQKFDGKWIYVVNCNYTQYQELLGGVPVVVADEPFEGRSDLFYDQFFSKEYSPRTSRNFKPNQIGLFGNYIIEGWLDGLEVAGR
ncbi:MAG: hypothetical protein LBS21_08690 [Clostridiales bacterium]|jgi:hypothetical protein|nr:hypothetical protein [Clostridiales bacterium]